MSFAIHRPSPIIPRLTDWNLYLAYVLDLLAAEGLNPLGANVCDNEHTT